MLKKIFNISIVLYPILSAYALIGPLDFGAALSTVLGGLAFILFSRSKRLALPVGYLTFFVFVLLAALFITNSFPLRILMYTFILLFGCMFTDLKYSLKVYEAVVVICSIFFIFQEVMFVLLGFRVSGIFTFLPTIYGDISQGYIATQATLERSSSFFLEPSYFSQYLFPYVVLELFYDKRKNHFLYAVLASAIVLITRSGNGILLLAIVWLIWLFMSDYKTTKKVLYSLLLTISFTIFTLVNPELLSYFTSRIAELSISGADNQYQTSGFIRIFRGFYIYADLPSINKIFGLNPELMDDYKMNNSLRLFDADSSFINGASTLLCLYGLVGFILFFLHIIRLSIKTSLTVKVLALCVFFLMFTESYFICARMLLVVVFMYSIKKENIRLKS